MTAWAQAAPEKTNGASAWVRLFWAMVIGTLCTACNWTMVALMPAIQAEFDLTRTESSYPYVATMLGLLVGNPLLGRFGDRAGITAVLIAASVVSCPRYIAAGTAAGFGALLVAQVAIGVGTAAALGPRTADMSHCFVRRRGLAVAMVSGSTYLSGAVSTTAIPNILHFGDWRLVAGMLMDRIGAIRVLLAASTLPMPALALCMPLDEVVSFAVVSLVFGIAQGGIISSYQILVRSYLPARVAGTAIGAVSMATLLGMTFDGWLAGWIYGHRRTYFLAFMSGIAWNLVNLLLTGVIFFRLRRAGHASGWRPMAQ